MLRVARDHRAKRWTRSHESPTPVAVRHSIPSRRNLSPSYSYLENEVASNCALTLENATSDRDALCIHMSVDGYLWLGFNSAELSTVATLIATYGVFKYEGNSSFHVLIFDKIATRIQYPPSKNCKLEDHQCEVVEQHMQHCEHQCSNGGQLTPKIIMNQFRDALPPRKWCIAKGCTSVYSREWG
nr:hypothetical protein CFP56_31227 [Quercus suber]